jgi:hypothetical protein
MAVRGGVDGEGSSRTSELDASGAGANAYSANELDAVEIAAR